jgi:cholest-4-en-3-one 26-monooxygenase
MRNTYLRPSAVVVCFSECRRFEMPFRRWHKAIVRGCSREKSTMTTSASEAKFQPDLLTAETFRDGPPHAVFDRLRQFDPLYGQPDPINGGTVWSVTRFADLRAVSADLVNFTQIHGHQFPTPRNYAASMRDSIMFVDPPEHTRLRSFGSKAFSPSIVARFEQWIREIVVSILDTVSQQGTIDMVPQIAAELPGQVIASIMGVPDADRRHLIGWACAIFGRVDPEIGLERAMAAVGTVREYAKELCAMKRSNPAVDMTSELLDASYKDVPITESELTEMVLGLILAGFETTHTLIAQSLTLIAQDDDVRRQVDETPIGGFTPVVEEMLRISSPVMHMARTAKQDIEMHGKRIAKGDTVLMWYTAANRDPAIFENPHAFIASRGKRTHLAFGAGGPHFCLGNHLARLEVEILFEEMRKRSISLELAGEPKRSAGIFINALRSVPMRVVREGGVA